MSGGPGRGHKTPLTAEQMELVSGYRLTLEGDLYKIRNASGSREFVYGTRSHAVILLGRMREAFEEGREYEGDARELEDRSGA